MAEAEGRWWLHAPPETLEINVKQSGPVLVRNPALETPLRIWDLALGGLTVPTCAGWRGFLEFKNFKAKTAIPMSKPDGWSYNSSALCAYIYALF